MVFTDGVWWKNAVRERHWRMLFSTVKMTEVMMHNGKEGRKGAGKTIRIVVL